MDPHPGSTRTGHLPVSASEQDGACDCRLIIHPLFGYRRHYHVGDLSGVHGHVAVFDVRGNGRNVWRTRVVWDVYEEKSSGRGSVHVHGIDRVDHRDGG